MKRLLLMTIILFSGHIVAQEFNLSAEIRPRFESKHGYKTLADVNQEATNAISQRTRLNFNYTESNIKLGVTLQNTRIWGDVKTLTAQDNVDVLNGIGTTLHQAWAEAVISDKFSMKVGRQEIIYDDHRIFGSVGWAQQARSHDAFIFKFRPAEGHKIDVGFAYNGVSTVLYGIQHKNFQYAHYNGKFDNLGVSFLALNLGKEFLDADAKQKVGYIQTIGPRFTYKVGDLNLNAATYLQMGEVNTTKTNALYYTFNASYKVMDGLSLGLGYESLSGNTQDPTNTNTDEKAFTPFFGTNHKFNGWMDYFYVGNHVGNVGLNDFNATIAYKNGKFSAKLIPHMFSAAAPVYDGTTKMKASLGTEIDFTMGYAISKGVKVNVGYSQMFATDTMVHIKGGNKDENSNWGWVMFTFKPNLFSYKAAK